MKVAPSMLASDFTNMGEEIKMISNCGADLIHLDIMDGHFVPNISFGPGIVSSLRGLTKVPFDVHLMVENPIRYISLFVDAGADIITFHKEATSYVNPSIEMIRKSGLRCGIAIKPDTDINEIFQYLPIIDILLIMTVEPGFGGQTFIKNMISKIYNLKSYIKSKCLNTLIEVDGGINFDNAKTVSEAGADICVAGTSIFKSENPNEAIKRLSCLSY
jgi:ribulose-phosphate 3-epimerase